MPNFHAFTSTQTKTKWSGVVDTLKKGAQEKKPELYCTRLDHGICPITIVMNTFYVL